MTVDRYDAAKGRYGVASQCSLIGFAQVVVTAKSTGVGMLYNGYGRFSKVDSGTSGCFQVKYIIERKLRPVEMLNRSHAV